MWVNPNSYCSSCKNKEGCEHFIKLDGIVGEIYPLSRGLDPLFPWYSIFVHGSEEIECEHISNSFGEMITISCGAIKKWSASDIKAIFLGFVYPGSSSDCGSEEDIEIEDREDKESSEEELLDDLSREDKVKKLAKILKITDPINVKISTQVNAWANCKDEIYVTSAALDQLPLNELAFIISHEKAHIDSKDVQKTLDLIDRYGDEARQAIAARQNFGKTLVELIKISVTGFAAYIKQSQVSEVAADVNAKLRLREIGYDETGGEQFFGRINHPISLDHPSSNFRKETLKKI